MEVKEYKGPRLSRRFNGDLSKAINLPYAKKVETKKEIHGLKERRQGRRELVEKAVEIMKSRLSEDLLLEDVAKELHVSTRHLQRAFREFNQEKGFRDELATLRIKRAATILAEDSGENIAEISKQVGYPHPMHFAKAFRRHMGMSPREWRSQKRESKKEENKRRQEVYLQNKRHLTHV